MSAVFTKHLNRLYYLRRCCKVFNIEERIVPYHEAWTWQRALVQQRLSWNRKSYPYSCDAMIILEHHSVFTLGRGSTLDNLKFKLPSSKHEVYRIERGGEVTWHGPGQLVIYPIFDLRFHKKDLHWFLRMLEEVIIRVLNGFNIEGKRDHVNTGVWVGNKKIAAIGLNASRWITSHGFSINVSPDMNLFKEIIPCGIVNKEVGCISELIPGVEIRKVRQKVLEEIVAVFRMTLEIEREQSIPPLEDDNMLNTLRRLS